MFPKLGGRVKKFEKIVEKYFGSRYISYYGQLPQGRELYGNIKEVKAILLAIQTILFHFNVLFAICDGNNSYLSDHSSAND